MQNFIITLVLFLLSLFVSAQEAPKDFSLEKDNFSIEGEFAIASSNSAINDKESARRYNDFFFSKRSCMYYILYYDLKLRAKVENDFSKRKLNHASGIANRRCSLLFPLNHSLAKSSFSNKSFSA